MQSSKLVVASLSCAELGTAQSQLVYFVKSNFENVIVSVNNKVVTAVSWHS